MHKLKRATFDTKTDGKTELNRSRVRMGYMLYCCRSWKIIPLTLVLGKSATKQLFFCSISRMVVNSAVCDEMMSNVVKIFPRPHISCSFLCCSIMPPFTLIHIQTLWHRTEQTFAAPICLEVREFFLSISLFSVYFPRIKWTQLSLTFPPSSSAHNILSIDIDTQNSSAVFIVEQKNTDKIISDGYNNSKRFNFSQLFLLSWKI